jgi:hypothetical protein
MACEHLIGEQAATTCLSAAAPETTILPRRESEFSHGSYGMCMIVVSFYDVRKDTCRSLLSNCAFAVELYDLFPICGGSWRR